jgi:CYTH domain-containing protein
MGTEIERKFLVRGEEWRKLAQGISYRQGYLCTEKERTVRVRTVENQGYLTIKGKNNGVSRLEYEYEIPLTEADELLDRLCRKPLITKKRYRITFEGFVWEVDEFFNENSGLIVAEIELECENQPFVKPDWIDQEVSSDIRYYNSSLIDLPYSKW